MNLSLGTCPSASTLGTNTPFLEQQFHLVEKVHLVLYGSAYIRAKYQMSP